VAVQMTIVVLFLPATAKFALVTSVSLVNCFSLVAAVRRIPLIRRVV
jgi:hypothetical protein